MPRSVRFGVPLGIVLLLLVLPAPRARRPAPEPRLAAARADGFDGALDAERERQELVGLAVAVVEGGELVHVGGYGWADRDARRPVTGRTLFRWASVSKPLTAVAAMQLVEHGRLRLDDRAGAWVPGLPAEHTGRVTVEQLLCHRSGIGHYGQLPGWAQRLDAEYGDRDRVPFDPLRSAATCRDLPLRFEPGTRFQYSTFGYNLLGAIVEAAGGEPFEWQVTKRIAVPCGMRTLQPDYEFHDLADRARGYRRRKGSVVASEEGDVSWKLPGGGYVSTVGDMARFGVAMLHGRLLDAATQRDLWTVRGSNYALGFGVRRRNGAVARVAHSGAQAKTRTLLVLEPARDRGIALMTNSEWARLGAVARAARRALGWEGG